MEVSSTNLSGATLGLVFIWGLMTGSATGLSLTPHNYGKSLEVDIVGPSEASITASSTNDTDVDIQPVTKAGVNEEPSSTNDTDVDLQLVTKAGVKEEPSSTNGTDVDIQPVTKAGVKEEPSSTNDTGVDIQPVTKTGVKEEPSSTNDTAVDIQPVTKAGVKEELNLRPIIGILSQEPGTRMLRALTNEGLNVTSYIAASYVKSVEGAGARVVPILIDQEPEYYWKLVNSLNGILFPGGATSIRNISGYGRAGDALYQFVLEANQADNSMPLWATCLGFEMLVYLAAGRQTPLSGCLAQDRADPLYLQPGFNDSRLWRHASPDLIAAVQTENITSNFHRFCVTPQNFTRLRVNDDFNVLSTNFDDNGIEYVSTIEHKRYPIFGTQWHPEKNTYEWKNNSIPHGLSATRLEHYMMEIFVEEARRNFNSFSSEDEASEYLIYNHSPSYVAKLYASAFQQIYYFSDS